MSQTARLSPLSRASALFAGCAFALCHAASAHSQETQAPTAAQLQDSLSAATQALEAALARIDRLEAGQEQLGARIDAYLLDNPAIVEQALATLEQRRMQEAIASVVDSPLTPIIGNPEGDVTVIEFFDYNCGYCRQMGRDLRELLTKDTNVRVAMVELPILSQQSQEAARISLAAYRADPEKYEKFHFDLMLGNARADGTLAENIAMLNQYDIEKVRTLSQDPLTQLAIQSNYQVMDALAISGTPALYVEGELVRGRTPLANLEAMIARARERQSQ